MLIIGTVRSVLVRVYCVCHVMCECRFHEFMRQKLEVVRPDRDIVVFGQTSLGSKPHDFHMQILGKARGIKCFLSYLQYSTDIECCMPF